MPAAARRGIKAGAKADSHRLLNILDVDIHRVAAKEERLIEAHAKWLEAQATGELRAQGLSKLCAIVTWASWMP